MKNGRIQNSPNYPVVWTNPHDALHSLGSLPILTNIASPAEKKFAASHLQSASAAYAVSTYDMSAPNA
jgi:hypothetical protein